MFEKKHDDFFDEKTSGTNPEKDLLSLINQYDKPIVSGVESGTKVKGKILSVGKEYAFVDINAKNEAMIKIDELADKEGTVLKKAGDEIEAFVVSNKGGEILLSTVLSGSGNKSAVSELVSLMKNKVPVEGKVTGINKGGFNVRIMGQKAFCPISQIDLKRVEDSNKYLNASLPFVITKITEGGRNIVVSRIPLLEGGLVSVIDEMQKGIADKKLYNGIITRISDFGLFVDLGEIEGLVHISEVSWDRTEDLKAIFSVGQKVSCIILGIEKKEPLRQSKISLSIKHVGADPWSNVENTFKAGQTIDGRITRVVNFGAFVQLCPGVEGLIHVSEMSWIKKIRHPSDIVKEGQVVSVTILSVDSKKQEISCSLKNLDADPWRDIGVKFPAGSSVAGTVAQETRFGYFIDIAEGVTGLLPFSNIASDKKESIKVNTTIEVVVQSIDEERRRISLSFGTVESGQNEAEIREYLKANADTHRETETVLGAALKKALGNK
jgi:small subunit ribosomal protein S1